MARWGDEKTFNFIFQYRNQECLWNVRSPFYKNKILRENAYQSLLESMNDNNLNLLNVKTKIKNLRSIYHTELKKVKFFDRSGLVYKPSLSWFDEIHSFLRDSTEFRETISNVIVPRVSPEHQSELATKETNEKIIQQKLLVPHATLSSSSSIPNDYNTRSKSGVSSQRKLSHSRSTHLKHVTLCTGRRVLKKKRHENDSISKTLQRLERISQGLNTTQQDVTSQTQDEFYFFALSVAAQLRNLPLSIAIEMQRNIQNTLSAARLSIISDTASPSSPNNCNSPICNQSSNSVKDQESANAELVTDIKIEESFSPDFLDQS